jgi:hypothetical protein
MPRIFLLSCMGPIDPKLTNRTDLASRLGVPITAEVIGAIMKANIASPCMLNVPDRSLVQSRALDKALTAIGIMSQICYIDPTVSKEPVVFVNQRLGPRREPRRPSAATSSHETSSDSDSDDDDGNAFMAPRKSRGRRKDDIVPPATK